jgi:hypothetical protein
MQEFDTLKQLVAAAEADVAKCDAGNKAAGTRVRKQMQDIKRACQAVRDKVMSLRGSDDDADAPQAPSAQ